MSMQMYKCPVCNGSGEVNNKELQKYKENQKKVRDFDTLINKHDTELREAVINARQEEREKQRRDADKQDNIMRQYEKQISKLKVQLRKMRQEKMTPYEQGKLTVDEFANMLREAFPDDEIDTPENSRPDVVHIIKENGKELRFLYELKDKETGYSTKDIEQTKETATEFHASFKMLVVKRMPKRMNGTHVAFVDNVVVSTIDSAVYLVAIFRKEYMENGVSSIRDLEKFISQRKEILNYINELATSTAKRREEHKKFYAVCGNHFTNNKQLWEIDEENIKRLHGLVTSIKKECEILVENPIT